MFVINLKKIALIVFIFCAFQLSAQNVKEYYDVYELIAKMLVSETELKFKDAVFAVEKAYNDMLNIEELNKEIDFIVALTNLISMSDVITYDKKDKDKIAKHASLFKIMNDTIFMELDSKNMIKHFSYIYNFDDPFGQKDWSSMFVSKLLETGKGNCHSLPYLYKILADELEIPCYLSFAPNHIYIKSFSEQTGWYNTELTSGTFPVDAWIMASGYITLDAIRNGLYMDTLNTKQAVANCLVDLAHGYQQKFGRENPDFVIMCCSTALEYHPANINAMLTKAEAQKHYIDLQMKKQNLKKAEDLFSDTTIAEMYSDMEQMYVKIHQLGYRRMPEWMYFEWIAMLKNEPSKYINMNIQTVPKK